MVDSNERWQPPTPPGGDSGDEPRLGEGQPGDPAGEDFPVGIRIGRNPANLGDEVADSGDVTFPETNPQPAEI